MMENYTPYKWEAKESWSSNPHIRRNRPLNKEITRDKEGLYIMIKGSIQEEDTTIVNIYAPNIGTPQYVKKTTDIKGEIDSNTVIVGDVTPHSNQNIKLINTSLK